MKDKLFNRDKVEWLAHRFGAPFDRAAFVSDVMTRLPSLELKGRLDWIAECLNTHLAREFEIAIDQVYRALPPPLDPNRQDDDFGDFIIAPFGEWAVKRGLETHPDACLDLLKEVTKRFSMEWALRPFLDRWPDEAWEKLQDWAVDDNYHVRRLVSEGTRPNLPWGQKVSLPLGATLPLLDRLYADRTRYVTRSVSNHLNDISKQDPDLVMDTLDRWKMSGSQSDKELDWMIRHALRSLIKDGHPRALDLLGYDFNLDAEAKIRLSEPEVRIGSTVQFEGDIRAPAGAPVLVDYIMEFCRPAGKPRRKVFKLKQTYVPVSGILRVMKKHPMKGNASTFTLYPGPHRIFLQVNGRVRAETVFHLSS